VEPSVSKAALFYNPFTRTNLGLTFRASSFSSNISSLIIFHLCRYFVFLEDCTDAKACTVLLRGGSKDVLNEIERNLSDAMQVVRNVVFDPKMLPGGGATELAIANALKATADTIDGITKFPYLAIANALEVIPRTLAQNCGANVIRLMTELRAKQTEDEGSNFGVDGQKGTMVDMRKLGIWEPYCVKAQTLKTAIESSCLILRIDDVVSGTRRRQMQE
jgi:T-complex protein 1 subunit gamma